MSTKLYMKQFQNSGQSLTGYNYASLVPSVLAFISSITNKINGTTQITATAGGSVLAWISPPLAASVTISSNITCNAWVLTSSTTGAPKTICQVYRYANGIETQFGTATSALTQSTSIQNDSFTLTPTSTAFNAGDRIVIKFFVSSSSATGTETLDYGGLTGSADGDTWIQITETASFQNEAEFIQQVQVFSTGPFNATLPWATATGNTLVGWVECDGGISVTSISDGTNTYSLDQSSPASANGPFFTFKSQNTGSGTFTLTPSFSSTPTGVIIATAEYAGVAAASFDVSASIGTGTSTSEVSGTLNTNFPNEILVAVYDNGSAGNPSFAGGYVRRDPTGNNFADKSVTTVQSAFADATIALHDWTIGLMGLKWGTQSSTYQSRHADRSSLSATRRG